MTKLSEVEKGLRDPAKIAARAAKRQKRIDARGGRLVQRVVTKPAMKDVDASVDRAIKGARDTVASQGAMSAAAVERAGRRAGRQVAAGAALGTGVGIAGGMTAGAYGQKKVRGRRVEKAAGMYPYLLPTIRSDAGAVSVPRRNPIDPLQQLAASRMLADGSRKVRSRNPFYRKRRTRRGAYEMAMGANMITRGV